MIHYFRSAVIMYTALRSIKTKRILEAIEKEKYEEESMDRAKRVRVLDN